MSTSPYLSAADAAAFLNISPRHLRRLTKGKRLTAVRIAGIGRPRYRQEDLIRLMQSSANESATSSDLSDFIMNNIKPG